jgi:hypothetical protein
MNVDSGGVVFELNPARRCWCRSGGSVGVTPGKRRWPMRPVHRAVFDETTDRWIPRADGAEIGLTEFTSRRMTETGTGRARTYPDVAHQLVLA